MLRKTAEQPELCRDRHRASMRPQRNAAENARSHQRMQCYLARFNEAAA